MQCFKKIYRCWLIYFFRKVLKVVERAVNVRAYPSASGVRLPETESPHFITKSRCETVKEFQSSLGITNFESGLRLFYIGVFRQRFRLALN